MIARRCRRWLARIIAPASLADHERRQAKVEQDTAAIEHEAKRIEAGADRATHRVYTRNHITEAVAAVWRTSP